MLEAFPERYKLFDIINQTNGRNDRYLHGSTTANKKFKSPPGFAAHLVWLLRNGPGADRWDCICTSCTNNPSQKDVNARLGLKRSTATYLPNKSQASSQRPNAQLKKPRAHPRHSPPPTYLGSYVNKLRDDDLAHNAASFRQNEMVWAKLPSPLLNSARGPEGGITHWPGLICAREVKVESTLAGGVPRPGEPPKFINLQRRVYKVQLLALEDIIVVEESAVLPWLGLSPTTPSPAEFQLAECSSLVYDGKNILTPTLAHFAGDSRLAMTAYALAIHCAAHIVLKFALTDPYKPEKDHIITHHQGQLSQGDSAYLEEQENGTHFQSVWWGAEQIHSEDLVRVVVRPQQIDQQTTLPLSSDTDERGFLFKLSAIFRAPAAEGKLPAIRVAGALVESVKVGAEDGPLKAEEEVDDSPSVSLPKPPSGYRFRQVTRKDSEVHIDIEYVAGRYYSLPQDLDQDPIRVEAALQSFYKMKAEADADESAGEVVDVALTEDQLALVLAGVLPGWHKCIHASTWSADRFTMVQKSEATSNVRSPRAPTLAGARY